MERFLPSAVTQLVFSLAALVILVAIACYVILKIRPKPIQKEHLASEWLSKCREMNYEGELSDEEFRTIKTTLAPRLEDELNDNGEEG